MLIRKVSAVIITALLLIPFFSFISYSAEYDIEEKILEESNAKSIFDYLDGESTVILNSFGIDGLNLSEIYSVTPLKLITNIINIFKGKLKKPLKLFFILVFIITFQAITSSFTCENEEKGELFFQIFILIISIVPCVEIFNIAYSQIYLISDFMIAYVPVYATLLSIAGKFTQSVNFNITVFSLSEIIVSVSKNYLVPVINTLFCFNIASAINPVMPLKNVSKLIKKVLTVALTLISTVFTGVLTIKNIIGANIDAITVKSVKTLSGSFIPIIGSSLGDSLSSVIGSINIINNSIGFLGILILIAIGLPVITELFLWYLCFYVSSVIADSFGFKSSAVLLSISEILSIVNIIVIFVLLVFIISTGIMLSR